MKKKLRIVVAAVFAFIAIVGWLLSRTPFSRARLETLKPGMTRAEVRTILGEPDQQVGSNEWIYGRFGSLRAVAIMFDEWGNYKEYVFDL